MMMLISRIRNPVGGRCLRKAEDDDFGLGYTGLRWFGDFRVELSRRLVM